MKKKFIYFLTLLLAISACSGEKYENNIPYKRVSFIVYPLTDFNKALTAPGGVGITNSCVHNGGQSCGYDNHGVIVCRMMQSDYYVAYAATCPADLTKLQIVSDAILKAKCNKCSRIFELDNNGISGNYRLLQYNIRQSITQQLFTVYN